jgi:hypothetical protein
MLAWAALILVMSIAMRALMTPYYQAQLDGMTNGQPPVGQTMGLFLLAMLAMIVVYMVLYAAVYRAVFFPERSGAAYLRFGVEELCLFGTMLALIVGYYVVALVGGLVGGIVGGLLAVAVGLSQVQMTGLLILLICAVMIVALYPFVRLSLAAPLSVLRRSVPIGEAWRLSRGRFWMLFGAGLVVWLIFLVLCMIMMLPMLSTMAGMMAHAANPNDPAASIALMQAQRDQMALGFTPAIVFQIVLGVVLGTFGLVAMAGGLGVATAQLLDEQAGRL